MHVTKQGKKWLWNRRLLLWSAPQARNCPPRRGLYLGFRVTLSPQAGACTPTRWFTLTQHARSCPQQPLPVHAARGMGPAYRRLSAPLRYRAA